MCTVALLVTKDWNSFFLYFLKLYFTDYASTVVLILPPFPSQPSTLHSFRQFPQHCSCPWVMHISSLATPFPILYFTSPWLFCNYLFVLLNPLTSSPIPLHSPPIWQPSKHSISMILSVLLVCLVCFLDSTVDRYLFLDFIVHSFDHLFLNAFP